MQPDNPIPQCEFTGHNLTDDVCRHCGRTFVAVDSMLSQEYEETAARALSLKLTDEDNWETLPEQERAGWRQCARAALRAVVSAVSPETAA